MLASPSSTTSMMLSYPYDISTLAALQREREREKTATRDYSFSEAHTVNINRACCSFRGMVDVCVGVKTAANSMTMYMELHHASFNTLINIWSLH